MFGCHGGVGTVVCLAAVWSEWMCEDGGAVRWLVGWLAGSISSMECTTNQWKVGFSSAVGSECLFDYHLLTQTNINTSAARAA